MTEAKETTATSPRAVSGLRIAVLVLAGVEVLLLGGLVLLGLSQVLSSNEALSRNIGNAVMMIYGIPLALCSLPALVLGLVRRWLWFALGLAVLAVPLSLASVLMA